MELWKDIPYTAGRLRVSNEGRIMSLLRGQPYILKAQPDKKGYLRLRVTIDREKRSYKVHRLVAEAFIDNPECKSQVNHINGDKADNRADNLEWATNKENANHAIKTGLWTSVQAGAFECNKAKRKPVTAINGDMKLDFESVGEAERYFDSRHITDVLKGKRPHVKGWSFEYRKEVVS